MEKWKYTVGHEYNLTRIEKPVKFKKETRPWLGNWRPAQKKVLLPKKNPKICSGT